MSKDLHTDYGTFQQIRAEILNPIAESGLDVTTLRSLHESKLIYLNELRLHCFHCINRHNGDVLFSMDDYELIINAIQFTKRELRELMRGAISSALNML